MYDRRRLRDAYGRLSADDQRSKAAGLAGLFSAIAHAERVGVRQTALNYILRAVNNALVGQDLVRSAWREAALPRERLRGLKGLPALETLLGTPPGPATAPSRPAGLRLAAAGAALAAVIGVALAAHGTALLVGALVAFNWLVFGYFLALNLIYFATILVALPYVSAYMRKIESYDYTDIIRSEFTTPISLLVPAYNEERTIVQSVRSFLVLQYPEFEVVVINDGSTDRTLEELKAAFRLYPTSDVYHQSLRTSLVRGIWRSRLYDHLLVIDKANGGKADALNAGINMARYPLFCSIDADSVLDEFALMRIARAYLEDPVNTVAVGGIVRIANGCTIERGRVRQVELPRNRLAMFQVIEYLRAFLMGRLAWSRLGLLMIISGAFGLFRKDVALAVNGYSTDTVGEDVELVVKMHRHLRAAARPYRILFIADPICWTEVPESVQLLKRQRSRWQRGLMEALWTHRHMALNPRYGWLGFVAIPYFVLFETLGAVVEVFGYVAVGVSFALGLVDGEFLAMFFLLAVGWGVLLSVGALLLEALSFRTYSRLPEVGRLIVFGLLENLGYRQLTAAFRLAGIWQFVRGRREWGDMRRLGFRAPAAKEGAPG